MNLLDLLNGGFELGAAAMSYLNLRRLHKDGGVMGFDWRTQVFYTGWGLSNLAFYPSNGLMFSFAGGVCVVVMNILWLLSLWSIARQSRVTTPVQSDTVVDDSWKAHVRD